MSEDNSEKINVKLDPEEIIQQGVHFGHSPSKLHPDMEPYLYGIRNTINIIDLEKTTEKMREALKFIKKLVEEDKTLLVVGTKVQVQDLTREFAEECDFPYVNERWIGGTFTNFDNISKRIDYLKDLEEKQEQGELEKYTKKEKAEKEEEIDKLRRKFGGLKDLDELPDAILVLHMEKDDLAVREAQKKDIKVIGIADTNVDPTEADYPIPANDDAITSIQYILDKIKEVVI